MSLQICLPSNCLRSHLGRTIGCFISDVGFYHLNVYVVQMRRCLCLSWVERIGREHVLCFFVLFLRGENKAWARKGNKRKLNLCVSTRRSDRLTWCCLAMCRWRRPTAIRTGRRISSTSWPARASIRTIPPTASSTSTAPPARYSCWR